MKRLGLGHVFFLGLLAQGACDCGGAVTQDSGGPPRYDAGLLDAGAADSGGGDVRSVDAADLDVSPGDLLRADAGRADQALADVTTATDAAGVDGAVGLDTVSSADAVSTADAAVGADANELDDSAVAVDAVVGTDGQVAADGAGPDADTCSGTQSCAQVGATRCDGDAVRTCILLDGCRVWGEPLSCPSPQTCSDGICGVVCTDECTEPEARRCASATRIEVCGHHDDDACLEWGGGSACPDQQTCSSGRCAPSCADECSVVGAQRCAGLSVERCGDHDDDGCLEWGAVETCTDDQTCSVGHCAPRCEDECTTAGARECDGIGYRRCGNFDSDGCLEWGTTAACGEGESCSGGVCLQGCFDECSPAGSLGCQGNATRACGNFDSDGCLEWGTADQCAEGTVCSNGVCALTCTDTCDQAGAVECHVGGTRSCGNFDADRCLEWGDTTPCGQGTSCSNGICLPECADECSEGQRRCQGVSAYQDCGTNYDADSCWDWGPPLSCSGLLPICLELVPGQASCGFQCQDQCQVDEPSGCHDGHSRVFCAEGADGCTQWQIEPCGDGFVCMAGACVGCAPDGLEVNNSSGTATHVPSLPYSQLALTICDPDEDWFELTPSAGQNLELEVLFADADGDLDMDLYDAAGQRLARSQSVSDDERLRVYDVAASPLFLRVYGWNGDSNSYALNIREYDCGDDGFEPNNQLADAAPLGGLPFDRDDLVLCGDDVDWYSATMTSGTGVHLQLLFAEEGGDLDLFIYDSDGQLLGQGFTWGGDREDVFVAPTPGEVFYIKVAGSNDEPQPYQLSLASYSCGDDALEPNNSRAAAADLGALPISREGLNLCLGDRDWFELSVEVGMGLHAAVSFDADAGDLDLRVVDADGFVLAEGNRSTGRAEVLVNSVPGDQAFVEVWGVDGADVDYTLSIEAFDCSDDGREPNDDEAHSTSLGGLPLEAVSATLCHGDEDWYAVEVASGTGLHVALDFAAANGDFDMVVLDPSLETIGQAVSVRIPEIVTLYGLEGGVYLIGVYPYGSDDSGAYTLTISEALDCAADGLEDNDSQEVATRIEALPFGQIGLTICNPDEDWFVYAAPEGSDFDVGLTFDPLQGDLRLIVYGPDLEQLAPVGSYRSVSQVTVHHAAPGDHYIRVDSPRGFSVAYDLAAAVAPACPSDPLEPNETTERAYAVTSLPYANDGLHLCYPDRDVLVVTPAAGLRLTAQITWPAEQADLDLDLYDAAGTLLDSSFLGAGLEEVVEAVTVAAPYYIVVTSYDGGSTAYDLSISAQ